MYYYFVLDNGNTVIISADRISDALGEFLQWKGNGIVNGDFGLDLVQIGSELVESDLYTIEADLVTEIVNSVLTQNRRLIDPQLAACNEMARVCPEDSKYADPILFEEWCDGDGGIPFQEFVKPDSYLTQCYRLKTLLEGFKTGLNAVRDGNPMPQWPTDPFARRMLPPDSLRKIYQQALDAQFELDDFVIPVEFELFMEGLEDGAFDVDVAMAGQYTETGISEDYLNKFVNPYLRLKQRE
jgi:hypothetical protein